MAHRVSATTVPYHGRLEVPQTACQVSEYIHDGEFSDSEFVGLQAHYMASVSHSLDIGRQLHPCKGYPCLAYTKPVDQGLP